MLDRHPDDGWILATPMKVSARMHRVLRKLADSIIPDRPRSPETLAEVTRHALVSLQYMPRSSARVFLWGMRLLNWCPLWRLRGLRPLTALPLESAREHLQAVSQSRWLPVRLLMYGPVGLFMSTYFDQDYVHRELGYAPLAFVGDRIELRRKWMEGREPGAEDEVHHPSRGSAFAP
jgi:hypothetical protein